MADCTRLNEFDDHRLVVPRCNRIIIRTTRLPQRGDRWHPDCSTHRLSLVIRLKMSRPLAPRADKDGRCPTGNVGDPDIQRRLSTHSLRAEANVVRRE